MISVLQQIIDGIILAIRKEFGDDTTIYLETVKQGLQNPCFFILPSETTKKPIRGERFLYTTFFQVMFLPEKKDGLEECYAVGDRLSFALEVLQLKDGQLRGSTHFATQNSYAAAVSSAVRGRKSSFNVEDGMLCFTIQYEYQFFVRNQNDCEKMQSLEVEFDV